MQIHLSGNLLFVLLPFSLNNNNNSYQIIFESKKKKHNWAPQTVMVVPEDGVIS